eukprot:jgi/Bigna1/126724/aug1.3_g1432
MMPAQVEDEGSSAGGGSNKRGGAALRTTAPSTQVLDQLESRVKEVIAALPVGKTPSQTRRRHELFARFDGAGRGLLSPEDAAEGVRGLIGNIGEGSSSSSSSDSLLDCKPVITRVFEAARSLRAQKRRAKGMRAVDKSDELNGLYRQEFRIMLLYLREFLQVYLIFSEADINRSQALGVHEFSAAVAAGHLPLPPDGDARKTFRKISRGRSSISWPIFCNWALQVRARQAAASAPSPLPTSKRSGSRDGGGTGSGGSGGLFPPPNYFAQAPISSSAAASWVRYDRDQRDDFAGAARAAIVEERERAMAAEKRAKDESTRVEEVSERYYALASKFKRLRSALDASKSDLRRMRQAADTADQKCNHLEKELKESEGRENECQRSKEIAETAYRDAQTNIRQMQEYIQRLSMELQRRGEEETRIQSSLSAYVRDYRMAVSKLEEMETKQSELQRETVSRQQELLQLAHSHHLVSVRCEELEKALSAAQLAKNHAMAAMQAKEANLAGANERRSRLEAQLAIAQGSLASIQKVNVELSARTAQAEETKRKCELQLNETSTEEQKARQRLEVVHKRDKEEGREIREKNKQQHTRTIQIE